MPFVKLALDDKGSVKVQDDKPVYLDEDGKEVPVDVPSMYTKIIDLGRESKGHRVKAEEMEKKFSMFADVEDIETWKAEADKAIESVKNFNDKDWLKADKVDSMKRQMKDAHDQEIKSLRESYDQTITSKDENIIRKDGQIRTLLVSNKFASCPLFTGDNKPTTMTPDVAEAMFGKHFKVEEDDRSGELAVRAYYSNGDLIYSKSNPGEPADFNEGISEIFDKYPGRDSYLRSKGGGSGAGGGSGKGGGKPDDIAILQKQYDEAVAAKNTALAISLKNRIHTLRQQQRSRAA